MACYLVKHEDNFIFTFTIPYIISILQIKWH